MDSFNSRSLGEYGNGRASIGPRLLIPYSPEGRSMHYLARIVVIVGLVAIAVGAARAEEVAVDSTSALRSAVERAKPGTTILIAPGNYSGGMHFRDISGTAGARITIKGADPSDPPVFGGGSQALHLSDCNYVTLADFIVDGCTTNGLNCDDGGSTDTPMHHLFVSNVTVRHIGPRGNHDGLKMSGIDQFIIRDCRFIGWGGSGIDMVGCHRGVVEDCYFHGEAGFDNVEAIQMKGGCADNLVQCCFFDRPGDRGLNLGGSTGLQFFRPSVGDYEATRLLVAGNRFYGGQAPVAWPTASHNRVVQNTIVLPEKWIGRILQETRDPQFRPSHDGVFEKNVVVFDGRVGRSEFINVGRGTAPQTWKFLGNAWFDTEGNRKPILPGTETDSVHQVDPKLADIGKPTMRSTSDDRRLEGVGARAWRKLDAAEWTSGKLRM
ncbi:MAG TPA: right-handed parallel beta-helix repeat-containing protein [Thermoguttaceae bacterium]|nr:right-handed parallel beta-helix repeat-containing protein [Thermoguttaceae bacterium]